MPEGPHFEGLGPCPYHEGDVFCFQPDDSCLLAGLKGGSDYRSNVGVVALSGEGATVRLILRDTNGATIGDPVDVEVPAAGWVQVDDIFDATGGPSLSLAWASLEVIDGDGPVWAYASVVDVATGDATTVPLLIRTP